MAPSHKSSKRRLYRNPKRITVYLPGALLNRAERLAKEEHLSLNATIVKLLDKAIGPAVKRKDQS